MLQRSPIKPTPLPELVDELCTAIRDLTDEALDASDDDAADRWDATARAAAKCDALLFQYFAAMSEQCREKPDFAGSFGDLEWLAESRAIDIRERRPVYDATRELRLSASQLGVGRYARGW